jgi:hypothetical protein
MFNDPLEKKHVAFQLTVAARILIRQANTPAVNLGYDNLSLEVIHEGLMA